jgi:hypothetical protein
MFLRNFKARAEKQIMSDSITVHLFERTPDGKVSLLSGLQFTTIDPAEAVYPGESINLPYETAQQLIDSLWDCGLRPSEGTGSAGALAATQKHLDDMRRLVFEDKPPVVTYAEARK